VTAPRGITTAMRQQDEPTREALRDLRRDLAGRRPWSDAPVKLYPVNPTRRPTNAIVILEAGTGNDTAALASALKRLKRTLGDNGTYAKLKRDSEMWHFIPRGERRRRKTAKVKARLRKAASRRAAFESRRDPAGRMPSPRREVRTAA
jgi:hypothetical protein